MIRKLRGLAVALALALLGMASDAAAQTTIRMWTFLNPTGNAPRERVLADIIQRFEQANSGIRVVVEQQVFDQMTPRFLAAHRTGNAPDIVWVQTDLLGDAIRSGALADLNPLIIRNWPAERVAAYTDVYWRQCTVEGRLHCLFTSRNIITIIYRRDFLREAGIDPATLTTWPRFLEATQRLTTRDASGAVARYGFGQAFSENQPDPNLIVPHLLAAHGNLFDDEGRARFATPAGVAGLRLIADMVTRHGVTPRQAITWTVEDAYEQFAAGRLAMMIGASVRVSTMQARVGRENVGMMLFPGDGARPHSPGMTAGWAVSIWSRGRNLEQAARFVDHMMGPDSDRLWVESAGQLPASSAMLRERPDYFAQAQNEFLAVSARGMADYGWIAPIAYPVGGFRPILNKAVQRVLVDGIEPLAALEEAEREFNRRNARR